MTQPPSPAGVRAPAIVRPMVVSWAGSSIRSVKTRHASDRRPALNAWKPLVDQRADAGVAARAVAADRSALEVAGGRGVGRPGRAVRHRAIVAPARGATSVAESAPTDGVDTGGPTGDVHSGAHR